MPRQKGIQQTHTWDSTSTTCTPIIYSQPVTESDDEEEFLPIFGISKNGEIEKLMSKEEVASKLKENLTSPGKWAIL